MVHHVVVAVHAINTAAHPTVPPGWRWAVQLGHEPFDDRRRILNAGWCPNRAEASVEGEAVGSAVAKALRMAGHDITYRVAFLECDPIPRES